MDSCVSNCHASRFSSFQDAQDNLLSVASRTCPIDLDQCDAARNRRDACNNDYNAHLSNPVLDANNNYDLTWLDSVFEEYSSCLAASGIENCE